MFISRMSRAVAQQRNRSLATRRGASPPISAGALAPVTYEEARRIAAPQSRIDLVVRPSAAERIYWFHG